MSETDDFLPELLTRIQAARHAPDTDRERLWRNAEDFCRLLIERGRPAPACEGKRWVEQYRYGERGE